LVNDTQAMRSGGIPSSMQLRIRLETVCVLPQPGGPMYVVISVKTVPI